MVDASRFPQATGSIAALLVALVSACHSTPSHVPALDPEREPITVSAAKPSAASLSTKSARAAVEERDLDRARSIVAEAVAQLGSTSAAEDRERFETDMAGLGALAIDIGALEDARTAWEHVVASRRRAVPEGAVELLSARLQVAKCLLLLGDYVEARAICSDAIERLTGVVPDEHDALLDAREVLGACALREGDPTVARTELSHVVAVLQRTRPGSQRLRQSRHNLSAALVAVGDLRGALTIGQANLAEMEAALPAGHPHLLSSRQGIAVILSELGDIPGALAIQEQVLLQLTQSLPEGHPDLRTARANLAGTLADAGQLERARALQEEVVAALEQSATADDQELLTARLNLATTLQTLGESEAAERVQTEVLRVREATLPADHALLRSARTNLGLTVIELGEPEQARELFALARESAERTLPSDHPEVAGTRTNLALAYVNLKRFQEAAELLREAIAGLGPTVSAEHPQILISKLNLSRALGGLGEVEAARELGQAVLEVYERTLPDLDPNLQEVRITYAEALWNAGDVQGALELEERILAAHEAVYPDDHPRVVGLRGSIAVTLRDRGELRRARAMQESVLAAYEKRLPTDHPLLLSARENLAAMLIDLGDVRGAYLILQEVHEARTQTLSPDDPDRLSTLLNLASTRHLIGDVSGARAMFMEVLERRQRTLPPDHPDLNAARNNLATSLLAMDDGAAAVPAFREILESELRSRPDDELGIAATRASLGAALAATGHYAEAAELQRAALRTLEARLPADSARFFKVRSGQALTLAHLEDERGLAAELERLRAGAAQSLRFVEMASHREVRERLTQLQIPISTLLSLARLVGPDGSLLAGAFALIESERAFVTTAAHAARDRADPELTALAARVGFASARLSEAVSASSAGEVEPARAGVAARIQARDVAERALHSELTTRGRARTEVDTASVARGLEPGACAVGLRRYTRQHDPREAVLTNRADEWIVALIVDAGGTLRRVDLGPTKAIDASVVAWRAAIGEPAETRGSGLGAETRPDGRVTEAHQALAALDRLVVEPILAACGGARVIHLALDGSLLLVPFDALSHAGQLLGTTHTIRNEVSFAELVQRRVRRPATGGLLAVGGVEFSVPHGPVSPDPTIATLDPVSSSWAIASRGSPTGGWPPLAGTDVEAARVAELFEQAFRQVPVLLTGSAATKSAVLELAPRSRFLHLATHGFFAGRAASLDGQSDAADALNDVSSVRDMVREMAPMSLCGLVLAGADAGVDARGEVPGVLTAEEIAGLDLSACELAVLSACETNVGMMRAGQGVQSLQGALHAAGVRTAITSLWKVDDEATRELFTNFYARIWTQGESMSTALWAAKMDLRSQGRAVRDWAGWVLTGAAD